MQVVGRQMKEDKYRRLEADLLRYARSKPLCPNYEIDIAFNGENYTLFLQPEQHNKIYALYALRSIYERDINAVNHELITNNLILSALMEMIIYQGVKRRPA